MPIIQTESQSDPDYYDLWESAGAGGYLKSGGGGFLYEDYLFSSLRELGLVPPDFAPAGSSNLLPDLKIRVAGVGIKKYTSSIPKRVGKVEVKLNISADFGQSGLKWSAGRNWYLDGASTPEALEMRNLLNRLQVAQKVNAEWGKYGPPRKFTASKKGRDMLAADYQYDIQNFKDVIMSGPNAPQTSTLFTYYGSKGTHYIQIGGLGLYYMGSDPLQLQKIGVKKFDGTLKLRIRRKPGGSSTEPWNYRFSTALLIDRSPSKSGFSLDSREEGGEQIQLALDPFGIYR